MQLTWLCGSLEKRRIRPHLMLHFSFKQSEKKTALNAACEVHRVFFSCTFLLRLDRARGEEERQKKEVAQNVTDEDLSSNPDDPDCGGRLCGSLLTHLHPRVIVSVKVGVGGDEQSQAEVRVDFGSDPSVMKLRLQTVPAQIWL